MIEQQKSAEHRSDHINQINNQVILASAGIPGKHQQRKHQFQYCRRIPKRIRIQPPNKIVIVQAGVERSHKHIQQQHQEIPLICVAHTATGKRTMMIPFQDANVADIAVPRSGRHKCFADGTQTPQFRFHWGQRIGYDEQFASDAGVADNHTNGVTQNVAKYECCHYDMEIVEECAGRIELRQDDGYFEDESYRNGNKQKEH